MGANDVDKSWLLGVDEAGYGPNLGPLVVAASAWCAPVGADLDAALAAAITREPVSKDDPRLLIADSKAVYQPGGGLATLERAVYASTNEPACWSDLVQHLGADPDGLRRSLPWHAGFDPELPHDAASEDVATAASLLGRVCEAAGVELPRLMARLVFPEEFNELVDEHGTKGAALSFVSIGLARRMVDALGVNDEPCEVVFDKHGGRNRYGALLQEHFHEGWVETLDEARAESRYRQGDRLAFRFRTKGETELPVALASMAAKLLRELAMNAFNTYWAEHVPGLKPTAGYPFDAKRFRAEIATKQRELGVADRVLWRER